MIALGPTAVLRGAHVVAEYGFEVSDALMERADFVSPDGQCPEDTTPPDLPDASYEERRAANQEFWAGLACAPEIIAEQQTTLEATTD